MRCTYLTLVEDVDGLPATTENLRVVLVDSPLRVSDCGDVLDHNDVIRVLAFGCFALSTGNRRLVEQAIRINHVVNDATLADLLALELSLRAQVVTIIVTKMVVRRDRQWLDTRVYKELSEDRLELRLPGLEVITTNERLLTLGKLDNTGYESVLWRTVYERLTLEDGSDSKESRGRHLGVRGTDRSKQIVGRVVHTRDDVAVALGIGSPEYNDTVKLVLSFEATDVGTNMVKMSLFISARDNVVSASLLVGSDEVGVVD